MRVIVDLGEGRALQTPLGETIRYHEGDLASDEVLWCESHKGRYGIHLTSRCIVYLPTGTEGAAPLPPDAARRIIRSARTNVQLRRPTPPPARPGRP